MRIVLTTESYCASSKKSLISGVGVFVDYLSKFLAKNGCEVLIIAPSADDSLKDLKRKKIYKNLELATLPSWPNPFRPKSRIASFPSTTSIKDLIASFKPDIIHLQDPAEVGIAALRAAKKTGIPAIITIHSYPEFVSSYLKFLGPLDKVAIKILENHIVKMCNDCQAVIAPTKALARELRRLEVTVPIHAISNGVDLERFYPGKPEATVYKKYSLPRKKKIVLYVGRLDRDKSLETILKCIPQVVKETPEAHFVFAGSGSYSQEYLEIAREIKVSKYVTWAGYIPHESGDLVNLYRAAGVFIMPSLESQSIAALEAMASGLPVIGADAGGLKEIIENKRNGLLFKMGSHRALARAVISLVKNESLSRRYGEYSQLLARRYDLTSTQKELVKIYEKVFRSQ